MCRYRNNTEIFIITILIILHKFNYYLTMLAKSLLLLVIPALAEVVYETITETVTPTVYETITVTDGVTPES